MKMGKLVFSCIGYVNVEIGSSGKAVISRFSEDRKMLSEVVVILRGS